MERISIKERRRGICHFQNDIININTLSGIVSQDLANKNTEFPGKLEFQVKKYIFYVSRSQKLHGTYFHQKNMSSI